MTRPRTLTMHRATPSRPTSPPALHVFPRVLAEVGRRRRRGSRGPPPRPRHLAMYRADRVRRPLLRPRRSRRGTNVTAPAHDYVHLSCSCAGRTGTGSRAGCAGSSGRTASSRAAWLPRRNSRSRRAVEVGPDVRQILSEVPERERHGRESRFGIHTAAAPAKGPTRASSLGSGPLSRTGLVVEHCRGEPFSTRDQRAARIAHVAPGAAFHRRITDGDAVRAEHRIAAGDVAAAATRRADFCEPGASPRLCGCSSLGVDTLSARPR